MANLVPTSALLYTVFILVRRLKPLTSGQQNHCIPAAVYASALPENKLKKKIQFRCQTLERNQEDDFYPSVLGYSISAAVIKSRAQIKLGRKESIYGSTL